MKVIMDDLCSNIPCKMTVGMENILKMTSMMYILPNYQYIHIQNNLTRSYS